MFNDSTQQSEKAFKNVVFKEVLFKEVLLK